MVDILATVLSFLGAYLIREIWIGGTPPLVDYLALLPVIPLLWIFLLTFFRAYDPPRTLTFGKIVRSVTNAVLVGLTLLLAIIFVLKLQFVSRIFVFTFGALNCLTLLSIRVGWLWHFRYSARRDGQKYRILIVGTGNRARRLAETLGRQSPWGCEIVGFLDNNVQRVGERINGARVLGTIGEITGILKASVVDEVILAIPRGMIGDTEKIVRACEEEGVKVRLMADLFEVPVKRLMLDELDEIPLLTFDPVAHDESKLLVKRVLDAVAAGVLLVILSPLMALIAMAIRLDSRGPALFTQTRVGLNKRTFLVIKFRTMHPDAEWQQEGIEHLNEAQGPVFKIRNDPRVTRVGRFLRHSSLDELPQLLNILVGDMSLVGPRPLPLRDVNLFDRGVQRKRFSVKPGLTCLWQISGRSSLPFSEWLRLDLSYIDNWSLSLDLKILLKTIPAVLRGTGAS